MGYIGLYCDIFALLIRLQYIPIYSSICRRGGANPGAKQEYIGVYWSILRYIVRLGYTQRSSNVSQYTPIYPSIQQYSAVFSSIRQYTAIYPSIANYKPIMGQASCEYIGIYCCILQYIAEGLRCLAAPRYTPIYPSIRLEDVPPISPYIAQ